MRSSSFRRAGLFFPLVLIALLVAAPRQAAAVEHEVYAGARGGIATLSGHDVGPAFGINGGYGLSDVFDATVEITGSVNGGAHATDVFSLSAGAVYKIDVFQWIPYLGLLAGYYRWEGARGPNGEAGGEFGASVQLGIDYLLTRELSLGADARFHASFADGVHVPLFTGTLGAEYRWGF